MFEPYLQYAWAQDILHRAHKALDFDLTKITQEDPDQQLDQIPYASSAIFVSSILEFELWKKMFGTTLKDFEYIVGLSLGEYTGAVAAGSIKFEDGLKLVYNRGIEMTNCVDGVETQTATLKAGRMRTLQLMADEPNVEIALVNSPIQTVISGYKENVQKILKKAQNMKVKGKELNVSVSTHNSVMRPATIPIHDFLDSISVFKAQIPIISNSTAQAITDPEDVKESLTNNVYSPGLFYPSIIKTLDDDCKTFLESNENKTTIKIVAGIMKYKSMMDQVVLEEDNN